MRFVEANIKEFTVCGDG